MKVRGVKKLMVKYSCGHQFEVQGKDLLSQVAFSKKCPGCEQGHVTNIAEVTIRNMYSLELDGPDIVAALKKSSMAVKPEDFEAYYECGCKVEILNYDVSDPHCMDLDLPDTCAIHGAPFVGVRSVEG